jgi:predicted RNA-binding Zn ribbon-like protein
MVVTKAQRRLLVKSCSVETSAVAVRELPIVGGQLALDFANTVDDPDGPARHDHIATYAGLVDWSVRVGTCSPASAERLLSRPEEAGAALERAHTLRAVVRTLFTAVATGESDLAEHWTALRPFVTDAVANAELGPDHALSWPGAGEPHAMLWPVAHAAAELLTGPELDRVKRCAGCPWLFVDHSRNGSRRWCAMNDCGTHAKIRRYVARRAAKRTRT